MYVIPKAWYSAVRGVGFPKFSPQVVGLLTPTSKYRAIARFRSEACMVLTHQHEDRGYRLR